MHETSRTRECLVCGMLNLVSVPDINDRATVLVCAKCDSELMAQSDGSTLTMDIAHHHETVVQALDKFERALGKAWCSHAARLRLVVGGGLIRDAVLAELHFKRSQGVVLDFSEENRGSVLVNIRSDSFF
jgi:hypothetical protein